MVIAGDEETPLPVVDWTDALAREVARINSSPFKVGDPVEVRLVGPQRVTLSFQVRTEKLLLSTATQILNVEPIILIFDSVNCVGDIAPRVWSGRTDFPRDIGHINPTSANKPASLCLARAGLQPIYDRYGIDGVLERLNSWLRDAKCNQLMLDSWEPVPIGEGQNIGAGLFNLPAFQDLANEDTNSTCRYFGVASVLNFKDFDCAGILPPAVDPGDFKNTELLRKKINSRPDDDSVASYIPWIFFTTNKAEPIESMLFGVWNNFEDICRDMEEGGPLPDLSIKIMEAVHKLIGQCDAPRKPIILLFGVWRPLPISELIYGVSKNAKARSLEVRAYLLQSDKSSSPIEKTTNVKLLQLNQLASREMLKFTSGVDITKPVALLGYGALGSAIADLLLRAGAPELYVADKDRFETHNISRHVCTTNDLYKPKVNHASELAATLSADPSDIKIHITETDIHKLDYNYFTSICSQNGLLLDATADARIRRHLSQLTPSVNIHSARVEIFDKGQLGVIYFVDKESQCNFTDLYYELCALSIEYNSVSEWLCREAIEGVESEELLYGLGCASPTPRLPKYFVTQHASAFMPSILDSLNGQLATGIGINPLSVGGKPEGWIWIDCDTLAFKDDKTAGWEVRMSSKVAKNVAELRSQSGALETGGYLYGGIDFNLKQIYVTIAADLPPRSSQFIDSLELGPAGRTMLEKRIRWKSGGKLSLVGTWHSHPQTNSEFSAKDRATMETFKARDEKNGLPTLLLITSQHGLGVYVWANLQAT